MKKYLLVFSFVLFPYLVFAQKGLESSLFKVDSTKKGLGAIGSSKYGFTANLVNSTADLDFTPKVLLNSFFKLDEKNAISVDLSFIEDQSDSVLNNNSIKVFLPELSSSGINISWIHGLSEATFFNIAASLGSKKLNSADDSGQKETVVGVGTFSLVFEHSIKPELISFYGGLNISSALTNVEGFNNYFSISSDKTFYTPKIGLKFIVQDGPFKGSSLDSSLLVITNDMKTIYTTRDKIVPLFKIGMTKPL
ncbi:MAG: hypothetical protein RLN81_13510 [Balneolaceae bacterium]